MSVPSDVRSVQEFIKDALAALASADGDEMSFADLKETYAVDKAKLEKSLTASEEKLSDANRHVQELEHIRDTLEKMATTVN